MCGYKRVVGSLQVGRSTRNPATIETSALMNQCQAPKRGLKDVDYMFRLRVAEHYFVGTQIQNKETFLNWDSW